MSANLIVDIGATADYRPSVATLVEVSPASGTVVGQIVDLLFANTYCNVYVAGGAASGPIDVRIQTSDGLTSGSFTDPTSGLPAGTLPAFLASGGIFWANSGLQVSGAYSVTAPVNNSPAFCSGGIAFAAFQRPQRYARLLVMSGAFVGHVNAGFVSQKKTTSSGGGFSLSPSSGVVNV